MTKFLYRNEMSGTSSKTIVKLLLNGRKLLFLFEEEHNDTGLILVQIQNSTRQVKLPLPGVSGVN